MKKLLEKVGCGGCVTIPLLGLAMILALVVHFV